MKTFAQRTSATLLGTALLSTAPGHAAAAEPDEAARDDALNFRSFAEALKSDNQDRIIAFCPGSHNPVVSITEYEDYTAGEISNTLPTNGEEPCVIPIGRWVNGAQYHILSFLGGNWGRGEPRFTDAMVAAYTNYVNSWGGVVTWDHPVTPDGRIPDAFLHQLAGLRAQSATHRG